MIVDGIVLLDTFRKFFESDETQTPISYNKEDDISISITEKAICKFCGTPYFEKHTHYADCPVGDCFPINRKWIIDFIWLGTDMAYFRESDRRKQLQLLGLYNKPQP